MAQHISAFLYAPWSLTLKQIRPTRSIELLYYTVPIQKRTKSRKTFENRWKASSLYMEMERGLSHSLESLSPNRKARGSFHSTVSRDSTFIWFDYTSAIYGSTDPFTCRSVDARLINANWNSVVFALLTGLNLICFLLLSIRVSLAVKLILLDNLNSNSYFILKKIYFWVFFIYIISQTNTQVEGSSDLNAH